MYYSYISFKFKKFVEQHHIWLSSVELAHEGDGEMKYRRLGRAGVKVSEISLGTMAFGRWIDEQSSLNIVDHALGQGINLIDTANVYGRGMDLGAETGLFGESELILGKALKGRRNDVVLATKAQMTVGTGVNDGGSSRYHIYQAIEASLKRLQTDYIDLYQIHFFDPHTPLEETMSALDDLVKQGKVRYLGCSNFAAWQLAKANGISALHHLNRFESVQPEYSLIAREAERELIPYAEADQVGIISYSPLGRGVLTGKYRKGETPPADSRLAAGEKRLEQLLDERPAIELADALAPIAEERGITLAQLALAWVLKQPQLSSAILGVSKLAQIDTAVETLNITLSADELLLIDQVSRQAGIIIPPKR